MLLKPWYDVITPRKDLCEGFIPEALTFSLHLNNVRDNLTIEEYANPEIFFTRTYLTEKLTEFAAKVVRRLSGETINTNAIFPLISQTGEGKTHALTLLYHLATYGGDAHKWQGAQKILTASGILSLPETRTAIFVGAECRSNKRYKGKRGEPQRKTLWGELAFQLGGKSAFAEVAEYDENIIVPDKTFIHELLPQNEPCLLLIDDSIDYIAYYREQKKPEELYQFFNILVELVLQRNQTVLVVSFPEKEPNKNSDDIQELQRYKQLIERSGKTVCISPENEIAEIIRRRLFNWKPSNISKDGHIILPDDANETCTTYAEWVKKYRLQLPSWFPFEQAEQSFMETYPFHPAVLALFTRKWCSLPTFQHTRGILRLFALLLAGAYKENYSKMYSDPLINLGTAPLEDPDFRAAVQAQLGADSRLETSMITDICGRNAFAIRLDSDASDEIKHERLHQKVATVIFFESNGGVSGTARANASEPEIRLAIGEPELNIEYIDTVLEALMKHSYYLTKEDKQYRFNLIPNLNKLFADYSPNISEERIGSLIRDEIKKVFAGSNIVTFFPEKSQDIPDRPALTLAVLAPQYTKNNSSTFDFIKSLTQDYGASTRLFKSAIIWVVPDDDTPLNEEARTLLTWQDIQEEIQAEPGTFHNVSQSEPSEFLEQIKQNIEKAQHQLRELIWKSYEHVALLNREDQIESIDLSHLHSTVASSLPMFILNQLRLFDYVADTVSPRFLTRNWPETLKNNMWSTKAVRDMFFISPLFPCLLNPEILKETIAKGASNGLLGYVNQKIGEKYETFYYRKPLMMTDVEICDDMFIIIPEMAEEYLSGLKRTLTSLTIDPPQVNLTTGEKISFTAHALDENGEEIKKNVHWEATGGTIDQDGLFVAGGKDGSDFEVRATAGEERAWVKVSILSKKSEPPSRLVQQLPPIEGVKEPPLTSRISWSGQIPGENWVDFYTKIISHLTTDHKIKIDVHVEISKENGISPQSIEEMKSVLRELGLDDTIRER